MYKFKKSKKSELLIFVGIVGCGIGGAKLKHKRKKM